MASFLSIEIIFTAYECFLAGKHSNRIINCRNKFIKNLLNSAPNKTDEKIHNLILKLHQMNFHYTSYNCFIVDYKIIKMVSKL